jgi:hypothetical protein
VVSWVTVGALNSTCTTLHISERPLVCHSTNRVVGVQLGHIHGH